MAQKSIANANSWVSVNSEELLSSFCDSQYNEVYKDWGGYDLKLDDGDKIAGWHKNIATFSVPANKTGYIQRYRPGFAKFNGTASLTTPDHTDWLFGNGIAFSIESFVLFKSLPTSGNSVALISQYETASKSWALTLFNNSGVYTLRFIYSTDGTTSINIDAPLTTSPIVDKWYHIAVMRSTTDNFFYFFLDGYQVTRVALLSTVAFFDSSGVLRIGSLTSSNTSPLTGYMNGIRISKGIQRWTTGLSTVSWFSLPTAQYTVPADSYTKLLLFLDADSLDKSLTPKTITNNSVTFLDGTQWGLIKIEADKIQIDGILNGDGAGFPGGGGGGGGSGADSNSTNWVQVLAGKGGFGGTSQTNPPTAFDIFSTTPPNGFGSGSFGDNGSSGVSLTGTSATGGNGGNGANGAAVDYFGLNILARYRKKYGLKGYAGTPSISPTNGKRGGWNGRDGTNYFLNARLDELRISNIARWTSPSFSVPVVPYTSDGNTKLLLHGSDFTDSSSGGHVMTNVDGGIIDTTIYKFTTGSLSFDGNSYLTSPDSSDWSFGSGSFTIDCWLYLNTVGKDAHCIVSHRQNDDNFYRAMIDSKNKLSFMAKSNGTVVASYITTDPLPSMSINTWFHIAIVRNGTSCYMYKNGSILDVTQITIFSSLPSVSGLLYIGTFGDSTNEGNCNNTIENPRIFKIDEARMRIGGGGAGAGGGAGGPSSSSTIVGGGGGGGAGGGPGGAFILLQSTTSFNLNGSIVSRGFKGVQGSFGSDAYGDLVGPVTSDTGQGGVGGVGGDSLLLFNDIPVQDPYTNSLGGQGGQGKTWSANKFSYNGVYGSTGANGGAGAGGEIAIVSKGILEIWDGAVIDNRGGGISEINTLTLSGFTTTPGVNGTYSFTSYLNNKPALLKSGSPNYYIWFESNYWFIGTSLGGGKIYQSLNNTVTKGWKVYSGGIETNALVTNNQSYQTINGGRLKLFMTPEETQRLLYYHVDVLDNIWQTCGFIVTDSTITSSNDILSPKYTLPLVADFASSPFSIQWTKNQGNVYGIQASDKAHNGIDALNFCAYNKFNDPGDVHLDAEGDWGNYIRVVIRRVTSGPGIVLDSSVNYTIHPSSTNILTFIFNVTDAVNSASWFKSTIAASPQASPFLRCICTNSISFGEVKALNQLVNRYDIYPLTIADPNDRYNTIHNSDSDYTYLLIDSPYRQSPLWFKSKNITTDKNYLFIKIKKTSSSSYMTATGSATLLNPRIYTFWLNEQDSSNNKIGSLLTGDGYLTTTVATNLLSTDSGTFIETVSTIDSTEYDTKFLTGGIGETFSGYPIQQINYIGTSYIGMKPSGYYIAISSDRTKLLRTDVYTSLRGWFKAAGTDLGEPYNICLLNSSGDLILWIDENGNSQGNIIDTLLTQGVTYYWRVVAYGIKLTDNDDQSIQSIASGFTSPSTVNGKFRHDPNYDYNKTSDIDFVYKHVSNRSYIFRRKDLNCWMMADQVSKTPTNQWYRSYSDMYSSWVYDPSNPSYNPSNPNAISGTVTQGEIVETRTDGTVPHDGEPTINDKNLNNKLGVTISPIYYFIAGSLTGGSSVPNPTSGANLAHTPAANSVRIDAKDTLIVRIQSVPSGQEVGQHFLTTLSIE